MLLKLTKKLKKAQKHNFIFAIKKKGFQLWNPFLILFLFFSYYNALILSIAATVFSYEPNAVSRKYPSPLGPNPDPGVPTTLAFSNK